MEMSVKNYIDQFDKNIILLYKDIISNSDQCNLAIQKDEEKKELFTYIFNNYLDNESPLRSLYIFYGVTLKDIKIFKSIENFCINTIKDKVNKINFNTVRNIFIHLDTILFLSDNGKLDESIYDTILFDEYLYLIKENINKINLSNAFYYIQSVVSIFAIKFFNNKLIDLDDIQKIIDTIYLFNVYGQFSILQTIISIILDSNNNKEIIKDEQIYNNLVKTSIKIFSNEELIKKSPYKNIVIRLVKSIVDVLCDNEKYIIDIIKTFFPSDEEKLNKIFQTISNYDYADDLDIIIYCLSKRNIDINKIFSGFQFYIIIRYLALYFKDEKIIINDIDLSSYIDIVKKSFLDYCKNYEIKKHGFIFPKRYENILSSLNPTKEEFNDFSENMKIFFYYNIIDEGSPLFELIPENVKKEKILDRQFREKLEKEEKEAFEYQTECIHLFFDKDKLVEDVNKIINKLGNDADFTTLDMYNTISDKYKRKEEYLKDDYIIVNPFIKYYFLTTSKDFNSGLRMTDIIDYINDYWDKHWAIHLYNYILYLNSYPRNNKVEFTDEEKVKIKEYFNYNNYQNNISDLINIVKCSDKYFLYFIYYRLENIFEGIDFEYTEELIYNLVKIPYYYYNRDVKLYKNYFYLDYNGIWTESFFNEINFENFFNKNEDCKINIIKKLIENIDRSNLIDEFKGYYHILSIIKIYDSLEENEKIEFKDSISELILEFYRLSLYKKEESIVSDVISDFINKNNLKLEILKMINSFEYINYYHFKYINNLQLELLQNDELYKNEFICDFLYKIRLKIYKKEIQIVKNISPHISATIKNYIGNICKYKDKDITDEEELKSLKDIISNINNELKNNIDFNFNEYMFYTNFLYLQSFIINDITLWNYFTEYISNNIENYHDDMIAERYIFENLFSNIDKNKFNFNLFVDKLIKCHNKISPKYIEEGIIPNENLIIGLLNKIIFILAKLNIERELYKRIYNEINILNIEIREKLESILFSIIKPVKIIKNNDIYEVYYLSSGYNILNTNNIDDIVNELIPYDEEEVSKILYFKYLLKDMENGVMTFSHPYTYEDHNEKLYDINSKIYISCFSKTVNTNNVYAMWKIYGYTENDDIIKVRITFNKRILIKSILERFVNNAVYYIGDIEYDPNKNITNVNDDIKDFFYKSDAFQFENEFRILVDCNNVQYIDRNTEFEKDIVKDMPVYLQLPISKEIYKTINLYSDYSFNPYKNIDEKYRKDNQDILKKKQNKI
ncbi:putative uncharacterized protein [Brachyspira suanatina]|uniref:Uncharacterized protein n=1 Tax=Brachyspira suanatina TaxID=381802 RepID=A0A0G4K8D5_9SPIR|nr:hypothetical protein [Brachyspira suanatina]CRF34214.1 putative uncharacterized protein [Brachyspira suanatina]